MRNLISGCLVLAVLLMLPLGSYAAADIEIATPAIEGIEHSMQQRYNQLGSHYDSGAVGLTRDGLVVMRDANAVSLAARQSVNALIAAENQDRKELYREIARANNHPEWEEDIRGIFARRWIQNAKSGWWYQKPDGSWSKK
jgi:uncharacterized protein